MAASTIPEHVADAMMFLSLLSEDEKRLWRESVALNIQTAQEPKAGKTRDSISSASQCNAG